MDTQSRLGKGLNSLAGILTVVLTSTVSPVVNAAPTFLSPTPYLSFADSPFNGLGLSPFYLEDWEDSILNTPGVSSTGVCVSPTSCFSIAATDSVDADDGLIDGSGNGGHSQWSSGSTSFTFDASVLGGLPTHVGIVWTDGSNPVIFEAFDASLTSLGTVVDNIADGNFLGGTAEDHFFGVIDPNGIRRITISDSGGIEVDHLQYGGLARRLAVPEPSMFLLIALGLVGMGFARKQLL